jgi:hypothetical protein
MTTNHPTAHTVPHPVLFNAWKHHAGWVRGRIVAAAAEGEGGLKQLADEVVVTGTKLMDFYTGRLSPWEVGERVVERLHADGKLDHAEYKPWVESHDGYVMLDLSDDGSRWVLRLGDEAGRYVHLHTARYSPHSLRVPGITLKTAILANALATIRGLAVADLTVVNEARKRFLTLPPVAKLTDDAGIGEVLRVLS